MIVEHFRLGKLWFNLNMNSRVFLLVVFLLSLSLGSFTSCKEPSTGPETESRDSLVLKFKDSDLTSATLSLHTVGIPLPATFFLTRNLDTVQTVFLHQPDTTMLDTALTPSTTYIWQAVLAKSTLKSKPVTGRTMDTTSHEFSWDIQYIGGFYATDLWDIVMVNDTLAFAVGEIYTDPAADPDTGIYKGKWNVAKWNGRHWTLMKVYGIYHEKPFFTFLDWICKTDDEHIWLPNSTFWNGHQFQNTDVVLKAFQLPMSISHMWGNSPKNIYAVGLQGEAAHWNGTSWTVISTGSALQFFDIWGDGNEVLSVSASWTNADKKVFSLSPTSAKEIDLTGVPYQVYSAWFQKDKKYVLAGGGVYEKKQLGNPGWYHYPDGKVTNYESSKVRGNAVNNIFITGSYGELVHFNGSTWKNYQGELGLQEGALGNISIYNNTVMIVGFVGRQAVILTGRQK